MANIADKLTLQKRLKQEKKERNFKDSGRGNAILEEMRKMNFWFVYGSRPSVGVKANTDMVKSILFAFMENADRLNCMVLIPEVLEFLKSDDASFETASSNRIQTVMLFYRHNVVTHSIGIVFYHNMFRKGRLYFDL